MAQLTMTRAPLRVSFFGGGTDFPEYFTKHGGAVLATAIDEFLRHRQYLSQPTL